MKFVSSVLVAWVMAALAIAAEKQTITSQDQLPRYSYALTGDVTKVLADDAAYQQLADAVQADLEKLLNDYEIADRATLQDVLSTLLSIDLQAGRFESALERIQKIRSLEEKPAAKLTTGLLAESYIAARRSAGFAEERAFRAAFRKTYAAKLAALPWEVVGDLIKQVKGSAEIVTEPLVMGNVASQFQPGVDKTGAVSGEVARMLVSQRTNVALFLPLRPERVDVLTAYVKRNEKVKADIWAARSVELSGEEKLEPVIVAIWDSGVDMPVFAGRQWRNVSEQANGRDDDGNGFIDDVHGIAYDIESRRTTDLLLPLSAEQRADYPAMRRLTKGLLDVQAAIDSPEAAELKKRMAVLQAAEVKALIEGISLFANFTHGTHVAGIAAAGNPAVRLMGARITFDYRMVPLLPTLERAEREAQAMREVVRYFRRHRVRVVNMSWGGSPQDIEGALEANGAGGTPEERKNMAREFFELSRVALTEAMREAPEILFVCAAGNSDNDAAFAEVIPAGIDLPNVLTVGAVDRAGEETSFTSFGKNVDVHASGFEVESTLPGGELMKYSGTSMASPYVANLAAKLLAIEPSLPVETVIEFIQRGCERTPDGRINLINPKRSVELLREEKARRS